MIRSQYDSWSERLSPAYRYTLAIALAVIALSFRFALLPVVSAANFTAFYPVVVLSFYLFGVGPGITTLLLTAVLGFYFFFPPYSTFVVTEDSALQTSLYVLAAGICGYLVSRMHTYRRELVETKDMLAKDRLAATANELSVAVEGARLGVWKFLPEASIVIVSDRFAEQFGLPSETKSLSYERILSIIYPEDRDSVHKALLKSLAEKTDFVVEHRVVWPDGSVHWIYGHGRPAFAADGTPERVDGITINITERKLVDLKYGTSLGKIKAAFDSMNEAILIGDIHGNLTEMNYAVAPFFHFKGDEEVFKTYAEFSNLFEISTVDGRKVVDPYNLALQGIKRTYELKIRRKDTGDTWYALAGTSPIFDEKGEIVGTASTALDITDRIEVRRRLEKMVQERTEALRAANLALIQLSRHDALTGLDNRLSSDERLRSEFNRMKRTGEIYGVLMADIDLFKTVNDRFGHRVGDEVLQLVCKTLSKNLREYDFIARWGGEEFLVLLPATDFEEAYVVAEKLRFAVESETHPIAGNITISIGVAVASLHDFDEDGAVMKADAQLYEAKKSGRNCVVPKTPPVTVVHPSILE